LVVDAANVVDFLVDAAIFDDIVDSGDALLVAAAVL
jgi:hypothetical protein